MSITRFSLQGLAVLTLVLAASVSCVAAADVWPAATANEAVATTAVAVEPLPQGFDPARHMLVSEVKAGMTGYGLSVFKGTAIERFDVKVLSILKNFNPKSDIVLIECKGQNLEHTGSVAGMSGSPVYLRDEQGRDRLIGAFAYGWPMMKDPWAGVQPIQYMLAIPDQPSKPACGVPDSAASSPASGLAPAPVSRIHWSLREVPTPRFHATGTKRALASVTRLAPSSSTFGGTDEQTPRLQPLATPLMASGMSGKLLADWGPALGACGLVPLQAGASVSDPGHGPSDLLPGSVLAIPMLSGDADLTAIGTCTEVLGDRVLGFGHSFNNEGPVSLPLGTGSINAIIANLNTSFKLGSVNGLRGTLFSDQNVGIAGRLGPAPATVPMDITIAYADGSQQQNYHFNLALHPKFTPLLAAAAMGIALTSARDLPEHHTVDYDLDLAFDNGKSIHLVNRDVDAGADELFAEIGLPIAAAAENPFQRVSLARLRGRIIITPQASQATILSVSVPRLKYKPGDTVRIFLTYRPFRAAEAILPIDFDIPRQIPDGAYQLLISDFANYIVGEAEMRPFRFTAETGDEVFAVLKDIMSLKHNALYLQLMRKPDGVALGRTALPHLPDSARQVLLDANLSDTTAFISSTLKIVATQMVMEGAAEFTIVIDRQDKLDTAATPAGHMIHPEKPLVGHGDEPKPKPPKNDPSPAP